MWVQPRIRVTRTVTETPVITPAATVNNHHTTAIQLIHTELLWFLFSVQAFYSNASCDTNYRSKCCITHLLYSNSMCTIWNGAQQMVNSRTIVIIILTARFFFLFKQNTAVKVCFCNFMSLLIEKLIYTMQFAYVVMNVIIYIYI